MNKVFILTILTALFAVILATISFSSARDLTVDSSDQGINGPNWEQCLIHFSAFQSQITTLNSAVDRKALFEVDDNLDTVYATFGLVKDACINQIMRSHLKDYH